MASVIVEYYISPGLNPQTRVDTFDTIDRVEPRIHTTVAGVLEIRENTGNSRVLKAYAPGRWVDAKVIE